MKFHSNSFIPKRLLKSGLLISMGLLSMSNVTASEPSIWNKIAMHPLYAMQSPVKGKIINQQPKSRLRGQRSKSLEKPQVPHQMFREILKLMHNQTMY